MWVSALSLALALSLAWPAHGTGRTSKPGTGAQTARVVAHIAYTADLLTDPPAPLPPGAAPSPPGAAPAPGAAVPSPALAVPAPPAGAPAPAPAEAPPPPAVPSAAVAEPYPPVAPYPPGSPYPLGPPYPPVAVYPYPPAGPPYPQLVPAQPPSQRFSVWLTGYSWHDNNPPGSSKVSHPVLHGMAGGQGTFDDPITAAVAGSGGGIWSPGSKFYLPTLARYVIVEDTGAGAVPSGDDGHLDVWIDGRDGTRAATDDCMARFTAHRVQAYYNPPPGLPVITGPIFADDTCNIPGPERPVAKTP
ncbi:hypothetical protein [Pseudonocardia acaciae]|uniref:hypothetical protein n=1 Tax=Pseudonocardia acaciae TaxID=551276 RepID=UPI0012EE703A|nr:hypothetical protein [Pseudonocardia acaciae]